MATLAAPSVVVNTADGKVRGMTVDGVCSFKGIPYAAPPYGENRFKEPRPPRPWVGIRDALEFGPKSFQPIYPPEVQRMLPELVGSGEDCLTLNVWAPETGTEHPVMVWIPGGVYEFHATGACPWYDGTAFARDGVVCVTIGYRPGPDGFLYFGEGPANLGLLDQIAALEWVQENIASFGGDPDNVTVFGESAGALSIGTLLSVPRAEGLFRRAILQSGAAQFALSVEDAKRIGMDFAQRLGVEPTLDAIAAVPIERLLQAQVELRNDIFTKPDPQRYGKEVPLSVLPWEPVIDGNVVPGNPLERIRDGAGKEVDLLIGTNVDENRLFLAGMIDQVPEEAVVGLAAAYGLSETALAAYRAARPNSMPGDVLAALQTDWYWRIPALRLADAHAEAGGATYMYEFAWKSPIEGGTIGAGHALEVPFVFDTIDKSGGGMAGPNPPKELADSMHNAWVEFATDGHPGWPRYDTGRRATMRFDERCEVVDDPMAEIRPLWEGVR